LYIKQTREPLVLRKQINLLKEVVQKQVNSPHLCYGNAMDLSLEYYIRR